VAADADGATSFVVPEETPLAPELSLAFWRLLRLGVLEDVCLLYLSCHHDMTHNYI
jgi:hypothetical protein